MFGGVDSNRYGTMYQEWNPHDASTDSTKAMKAVFTPSDTASGLAASPKVSKAAASSLELQATATPLNPLREGQEALEEYRKTELEIRLELLQQQLKTEKGIPPALIGFLPFLRQHDPQPESVRSYTCLMRLLPDLPGGVGVEEAQRRARRVYIAALLMEVHRCLSVSLREKDPTRDQFLEICKGLRAYAYLPNGQPFLDILAILSSKLPRLPSIKDLNNAKIKDLNNAKIRDLNNAKIFSALRSLYQFKLPHSVEVDNFIKDFIGKIDFLSTKLDPELRAKIYKSLEEAGYLPDQIKIIMRNNYPSDLDLRRLEAEKSDQQKGGKGNDGWEVVFAARWSAIPQFACPTWSQTHGASRAARGGPQNPFSGTPSRWQS